MKRGNKMPEPILRWPGAKWRLADWIVSMLPQHKVYCEPFFGSGAVFFTKNPSGTETINDIDDNVINLFRVVRDNAKALSKAIEMTPYSRSEYGASCHSANGQDNEIEQARQFLVRTWQAFGGKTKSSTSWSHDRTNTVFRPLYWSKLPGRILDSVERLKMAQIENMNALELIEMYNNKNTLLYIDPPYLSSTRTNLHYHCEFASESEHKELLRLCKKHKGHVIISAYENELYNDELDGWEKQSKRVATSAGGSSVETIYLSPSCTLETNLFAEGMKR